MSKDLIKKFSTRSELINEIKEDKETRDVYSKRNPVRFIFLPDYNELQQFRKFMNQGENIKELHLEKLLPGPDMWITPNDIKKFIPEEYKSTEKDILITPLSEIVRFYKPEKFKNIFTTLQGIENTDIKNKDHRIYVPLLGLYERFKENFFDRSSRTKKGEWAPIWRLEQTIKNKKKVYILDSKYSSINFDKNEYYPINSSEDWLKLHQVALETFRDKDIICLSKTLSTFYKNSDPDSYFEFSKLDNEKKIITKLFDIDIPIEYIQKEESRYWRKLLKFITSKKMKRTSFKKILEQIYNVKNINDISKNEALTILIDNDDNFKFWLLKHHILKNLLYHGTYFRKVLENLDGYSIDNLEHELWIRILLDNDIKEDHFAGRLHLLNYFYDKTDRKPSYVIDEIKNYFKEYFEENNLEKSIKILTPTTDYEKRKCVDFTKKILSEDQNILNRRDLTQIYKKVYPSLHKYFNKVRTDNVPKELNWVYEYFDEYRWSKILDKRTEKFKKLLNKYNKNSETFYSWYQLIDTNFTLLDNNLKNVDKVFWLDCVGFEWYNLLFKILSEDYIVEESYMAKANLPTITETNNLKIDDKVKHILTFDKFLHTKKHDDHSDDVILKMNKLEKIIKDISVSKGKSMIISDHGSTFFVRKKYDAVKTYDFSSSDHNGRCAWSDKKITKDTDYIQHESPKSSKEKGKYFISCLKHCSLKNLPSREVHGGATPEEILVPVILIDEKQRSKTFNINPREIKLKTWEDGEVGLNISPQPRTIEVNIENRGIINSFYDDNSGKWKIDLSDLNPGRYKLIINIEDKVDKTLILKVEGGMEERDLL